jgi:hypothetical protein
MIPAVIATVVAMLICLIALFLPQRHQEFALKVQAGMIDLATVLVGAKAAPASQAATENPGPAGTAPPNEQAAIHSAAPSESLGQA